LQVIYERWRQDVLDAQALVEAAIDFSDEADVAHDAVQSATEIARRISGEIGGHLDDSHRGEILRNGFRVVLAGAPNAGKSSLLNRLARRDAAIVSDEPGTTRDVIEVHLDLGGIPVVVADTAGLRVAIGAVEQEGIRRTIETARIADLVIWLVDATAPTSVPPDDLLAVIKDLPRLTVVNKIDLVAERDRWPVVALAVSALTGDGLAELTRAIEGAARLRLGTSEAAVLTQARHRDHLARCRIALDAFCRRTHDDLELQAEQLRAAGTEIGRLTGRIDAEDVLGRIFGRFCIGK
jgi:tRNA modification GTPase